MTGRARSINREKLDATRLIAELENPGTFRSRIFSRYRAMIEVRRQQPAFHPKASFRILSVARQVFAILRYRGSGPPVLALTNISPDQITVDTKEMGAGTLRDLLSNQIFSSGKLALAPYDIRWLTPA